MPQHQLVIRKFAQISQKSVINRSSLLAAREVEGFQATKGFPNTIVAISGRGWWEMLNVILTSFLLLQWCTKCSYPAVFSYGSWIRFPFMMKKPALGDCNKHVATITTNPHLWHQLALHVNGIRKEYMSCYSLHMHPELRDLFVTVPWEHLIYGLCATTPEICTLLRSTTDMGDSHSDFRNSAIIKSSFFWVIMPCSPLKVNRNFGGTYRHYLQGLKISQARKQLEVGSKQSFMLVSCSAYSSTLKMNVPPKRRLTFQRTIQRYILKVKTLHNHHCDNLKFCHYILWNDTIRTGRPMFEIRQRRPDFFFAPLSKNQLHIQWIEGRSKGET
jgi:hypothetical protein